MKGHGKTAAQHVVAGTYRADRHGALDGVAADESHDESVWAQLEALQSAFDAAAADVLARGSSIVLDNGREMLNPNARAMTQLSGEIRQLQRVLGIGPRHRRDLGVIDDGYPEDDDLDLPPLPERGPRLSRPPL